MKRFNDEFNFNETWYCVKLPFREHEILPDNFQTSKIWLVQLLNKLNPEFFANYDEIMKTYKKENIIEKIETVGKLGTFLIMSWSRVNEIQQRLALYSTHHRK